MYSFGSISCFTKIVLLTLLYPSDSKKRLSPPATPNFEKVSLEVHVELESSLNFFIAALYSSSGM